MESASAIEAARKRLPPRPTRAAIQYMLSSLKLASFETFVHYSNVAMAGNQAELISHIVMRARTCATTRAWVEAIGPENIPTHLRLARHEEVFLELLLCRSVDAFLLYLVDLLRDIFRQRPETLRSAEQERLDFILQYSTMEELVEALAERRIQRLAFAGFQDLLAFFRDRLGLSLGADFSSAQAAEAIEVRNILVHNRGVVNAVMKRKLPSYPLPTGAIVRLTWEVFAEYRTSLDILVRDFDAAASQKFDLPVFDKSEHAT